MQVETVGDKRCIFEDTDLTSKDEGDYEDELGTWDYRQTTETSWQNCQKTCQTDWDCRFFTYLDGVRIAQNYEMFTKTKGVFTLLKICKYHDNLMSIEPMLEKCVHLLV